MLTHEQQRELIGKIRQLPSQLEAVVSNLTDEQRITRYLDGEWTVAQNVHHLADSHLNGFIRMKLILTEDNPTLKPYNQDIWADLPDGNRASIQDTLLLLNGLHRRWVTLLENLQEADWQRVGFHPEIGQVTVEDLLGNYAAHGQAHIDQIHRTLAGQQKLQPVQ